MAATARRSAPGSDARRRACRDGFTLIEVLVVLVIMGIGLALASVNLEPDPRAILLDQADRLAQVVDSAYMEAVSTGHGIGLSFDTAGWRCWRQDLQGNWQPAPGDADLADGDLGQGVTIAAVLQGQTPLQPGARLTFSPGGINAPFTVWLALDGKRLRLENNGIGRTRIPAEASP